jgi:hypothetical protein
MQSANSASIARATRGLELIIAHLKTGGRINKLAPRGRKARQFKPLVAAKPVTPRGV